MTTSISALRTVSLVGVAVLLISICVPLPAKAEVSPYATLNSQSSADVEMRVRQYFADIPTMIPVARCESGFRQYGSDGLVLFDPSYSMIGVFQISAAHLPHALAIGIDVTTLEGNLAYARHLYNTNGIDPWMSSFSCWGSAAQATTVPATTPPATSVPASTISISLGMSSPVVLAVQQMLNKTGYTVSVSGPGSLGNETNMLGSLTRNALRRFQCAKNNICSGDELTTGYGLLNDRTYQTLVAAATVSTETSATGAGDRAAEIATIRSQISSLTGQIDALNARLKELTQ